MKHVFVVHSGITYIMSLKVIEYYNIKDEDVHFWYEREFEVPNKSYKNTSFRRLRKLKKNMFLQLYYKTANQKQKNTIVERQISHDLQLKENQLFHVYFPHCQMPWFEEVTKHSKCKHYSYIEEGTLSYDPQFFTENNIYKKNFFEYNEKFFGSFGFENSFPLSPNKIQLHTNIASKKIKNTNEIVIVFDASTENLMELPIHKELYLKSIEQLVLPYIINLNFDTIKYKFHPVHYYRKSNFISFFNTLIQKAQKEDTTLVFQELNKNVILEEYCDEFQPTVFVMYSSMYIYAKKFGCKVISSKKYYDNYISTNNKNINEKEVLSNKVFIDNIEIF